MKTWPRCNHLLPTALALSADRVELWDEEHQEEILWRSVLNLALLSMRSMASASPEAGYPQPDIRAVSLLFRIGGECSMLLGTLAALQQCATSGEDGGRVDAMDLEVLRPWAR